ncbi:MAG: orotidine-5'-phosphate decarboxylase [Phycisphaerales bacterium JB040]
MPETPPHDPTSSPIDRLTDAIDRLGTPACVGLDPSPERFPADIPTSEPGAAIETFCARVIEAVAGTVPAVKPQSAHFERWGARGFEALWRTIQRANDAGLFVVLDAKRGDIGSTADHYAAAAINARADAITANPYLGPSGLEPFLNAPLLTYALVRTSNPDSDAVQAIRTDTGDTVAERVARLMHETGTPHRGTRGLSNLGAVVGATKSARDGARLRELMPDTPFLVPGVGAQGGTAEDVRPLVRTNARTPGESGILVNASRSVLYPDSGTVADAAKRFADELRVLVSAT